MMAARKQVFAYTSAVLGAAAFLVAILHFWIGPIEPQPALETVVAETAVKIRDATIDALTGGEASAAPVAKSNINADQAIDIGIAVLGSLAVILAAIGFIRRENKRAIIVGAGLGATALAVQFVLWMVAVIVVVILVGAVLSNFDGIIG